MEIPYDPTRRERTIDSIREQLGDRIASQVAQMDDDVEELAFRIACGEFGPS